MIASSSPKRRLAGLAVTSLAASGLAALLVTALVGPAAARNGREREREPKRDESVLSRAAGQPLLAIVSLGRAAGHHLRRRGTHPARACLHRPDRLRDAGRHLQRHPERGGALLQPLRRRLHALHAAHHLVGDRAARRRASRLSRLARLHPHAARLRRAAVRADGHGPAGDRGAHRRDPRPRSCIRPCSSRGRSVPRCRSPARPHRGPDRTSPCGWAPAATTTCRRPPSRRGGSRP